MNRRIVSLLVPAFVSLVACSDPPKLTGTVNDIWGQPIGGAAVQLEGVMEGVKTDGAGKFVFENVPTGKRRVMAAMDGYIKTVSNVVVPAAATEENMPSPELSLYVEPDGPGFYLVGPRRLAPKAYHHLEAVSIETIGTELGGMSGLPREGDATAKGGKLVEFVFTSTLRSSQLSQMNLQLHKLEFIEEQEVAGVLGATAVKVNLWVAKDRVEFDLTGMASDDEYLIKSRDKLKPGIYAFHTEEVLTTKDKDALDKTPKEMRVAYPFEVK
jgi:hypothetical protein